MSGIKTGVLYQENGMPVMVGDGTKKSKEGKKMPCVKRLHQGSEDSSKPSYVFGHIHGYIMTACIAVGLLQICSLPFAEEINASPLRWLRTKTNVIPSEASTADFMRKTIFKHFGSASDFAIIRLIQQLQHNPADSQNSRVI